MTQRPARIRYFWSPCDPFHPIGSGKRIHNVVGSHSSQTRPETMSVLILTLENVDKLARSLCLDATLIQRLYCGEATVLQGGQCGLQVSLRSSKMEKPLKLVTTKAVKAAKMNWVMRAISTMAREGDTETVAA